MKDMRDKSSWIAQTGRSSINSRCGFNFLAAVKSYFNAKTNTRGGLKNHHTFIMKMLNQGSEYPNTYTDDKLLGCNVVMNLKRYESNMSHFIPEPPLLPLSVYITQ